MLVRERFTAFVFLVGALAAGCGKKEPPAELAPVSSAALEASKAATPAALACAIDAPSSSIKFLMDSPLEKIDGDAPGSVSGELSVELDDLSKSSGLVKVDLDKLSLYQQKRPSGSGEYQERVKNPLQNEHARDWLQLTPKAGEVSDEQVAQNRIAEFRVEKLAPSVKSPSTLTGADRKITAEVGGTLRLHGRQLPVTTRVELTFHYEGEKFASLGVKTVEPFTIALEKFEIHPRDGAGKLVKSITDALTSTLKGKVKSEAPVNVEFTAKPK